MNILGKQTHPAHKLLRKLSVGLICLLPLSAVGEPTEADKIGFSVIQTSSAAGTQEALVVSSGSWFTRRHLSQNAVLIKHPQGDVLIDSGLGKNIESQFSENSFVDRQIFSYEDLDPVANQLERHQYDISNITKIIPTHLHWDHASGIEDFPLAEVWVQQAEYDQAINGKPPVHIPSQIDDSAIKWQFLELADKPYEGFASSYDLYGDGKIVLVDLSGHSAGQVGIFLQVSSGQRYFFIGDTTWTIKGIEDNAQRSDIIKWLVDVNWDTEKNAVQIDRLHQFNKQYSSIKIVPAHDEFVVNTLPIYPVFDY